MARQKKPFEAVQFTRESAERIASRVRVAELTPTPASPLTFEAVHGSRGKAIKLGTFTGPWSVGTYKTVTLHDSTATASVFNWCNDVPGEQPALDYYVLFANVNGTNSALEITIDDPDDPDGPGGPGDGPGGYGPNKNTCRTSIGTLNLQYLPGYSAGDVQLLGHSAADVTTNNTACATLTWYSVTTCSTAAA